MFPQKRSFNQPKPTWMCVRMCFHSFSHPRSQRFSRFDFYRFTGCDGKISQSRWNEKINHFKSQFHRAGDMYASAKTTTTFVSNFFGGLSIQFWLTLHRAKIKTQSSSFMSGGILSRAKLAWAYMIHAITSGNLYRRRDSARRGRLEMHNKGNQIFTINQSFCKLSDGGVQQKEIREVWRLNYGRYRRQTRRRSIESDSRVNWLTCLGGQRVQRDFWGREVTLGKCCSRRWFS